jgi:hypothetical protein
MSRSKHSKYKIHVAPSTLFSVTANYREGKGGERSQDVKAVEFVSEVITL